jgi:hypothetical protein
MTPARCRGWLRAELPVPRCPRVQKLTNDFRDASASRAWWRRNSRPIFGSRRLHGRSLCSASTPMHPPSLAYGGGPEDDGDACPRLCSWIAHSS